jgi:DmsE family decaheme c-type cytochrome
MLLSVAAMMFAQATPPAEAKPNQAPATEAAKPEEAKEEQQQPSGPAEYMGSVVCQGCHDEIFAKFQKANPHRILETDKTRGWEEKACESCHGPGSKHAESTSAADIINPVKLKPSTADRNCLRCHINQPTNAGRVHGGHARNQVACVSCHSVHTPRRAAEMRTAQCTTCHTSVWAQFQKPYRHNLPEGSMTCVDCHNPHGGMPHKLSAMRNTSTREPGCFKCHGDKRGPFTFEHAPVKLEGCATCHQPHGSANPRMLTRHEVRFQCMECHTNLPQTTLERSAELGGIPPAFHNLLSPRFRNCTVCHSRIHGSHVSRNFTR